MLRVSNERAVWLARHVLPHEPGLRAWLSRRSLAGLDPDDIVQETYARLSGLASVDHILNPRNYLFQAAKSVIFMHMRRLKVLPLEAVEDLEAIETHAPEPDPEQIASDRQELRRIQTLIASLPSRPREVFILRKVHGLSQKEIARRTGLSESTVEKHIGKCVRMLMASMTDSGKPGAQTSTPEGSSIERKNDDARVKRRH